MRYYIALAIMFITTFCVFLGEGVEVSAGSYSHENVNLRVRINPIHINGDSDLIMQAQQYGWPGNGSPENPYVISGYYIKASGTYCIWIENTTLHLLIINCILEDASLSTHPPFGCAIALQNASNVRIDRNLISYSIVGVSLLYSSNSQINSNDIGQCSRGIELFLSNNILISSNRLRNITDIGISIKFSTSNLIKDNSLTDCGIVIEGDVRTWTSQNISISNTINNKPVLYISSATGETISGNYGQIILAKCRNVEIKSIYVECVEIGIQIGFSNTITIQNCILSRNRIAAISITDTISSTVRSNIIEENQNGIIMYFSNGNKIYENKISRSNGNGILLLSSSGNKIYDNEIAESSENGILLIESSGNEITSNRIYRNVMYGVDIRENSTANRIYKNIFVQNAQLKKGIIGRSQAYDAVPGNMWYVELTKEGNYWDNWDGSDWGTPAAYPIDGEAGAYDKYPLLSPTSEIPYIISVLCVAILIIACRTMFF